MLYVACLINRFENHWSTKKDLVCYKLKNNESCALRNKLINAKKDEIQEIKWNDPSLLKETAEKYFVL